MNVSIADRPTVCHRWVKSGFDAMAITQRALDLGWQPLAVFPDPNSNRGELSVLMVVPTGGNFDDIDDEPTEPGPVEPPR